VKKNNEIRKREQETYTLQLLSSQEIILCKFIVILLKIVVGSWIIMVIAI